ncbi:MAG: hypothetical protein KatS3mg015_0275 [Fimbriimonadales bacterium]|nr:MAG: hypothetical protein KatS3mg015_0275 [Fimbriimonadales bacterium]
MSTVVMGREVRAYVPSSKGRVFTLHADGSVGLRTTETGEALRSFEFGDEGKYGKRRVLDIRPLANGRCLVVIHDARMVGGGEYVEIDPDRGTSPSPWRSAPVLCPSGKHYGVWLDKETIALLDSETRKRWRVIKVGTGWYGMVLSNDCSHLGSSTFSRDSRLGDTGVHYRMETARRVIRFGTRRGGQYLVHAVSTRRIPCGRHVNRSSLFDTPKRSEARQSLRGWWWIVLSGQQGSVF